MTNDVERRNFLLALGGAAALPNDGLSMPTEIKEFRLVDVPAAIDGDGVRNAANRAMMKTLNISSNTALVFLRERAREGLFKWTPGDFSRQITADTFEGIYVKANSVAPTAGAWVRQFSERASIKWFGAVGDYDPATRTGSNDTEEIEGAFLFASSFGIDLWVPNGMYYHLGELNYPPGLRVFGVHRLRSQFYIEIDNTMAGGRIEAENVHVEDIGHLIYLTAELGPDDGEYGSGWTLGRYYTDGKPVATANIHFVRCGAYSASGSPYLPAHALNGLGRISGVYVDEIEVVDFSGSAIHFHWGANGAGLRRHPVATYHPNDIRVRNTTAVNCGKVFTLSSCFNVTLMGIKGTNCEVFGDLLPGDEADFYAVADEKSFVGSAIHISDFNIDGLTDINPGSKNDGSMKIISLGISKCDFDASTGLGTQRLLLWKNVLIENGKLKGGDAVSRAIDLTGASGEGVLRNINITRLARANTGVRVADTRGNWLLDGISIASTTGIDWDRAWGVRCVNMFLRMLDRTGLPGDQTALIVGGRESTTTLTENKTDGATSISVAGLGAVLRPGDTIFVDGHHVKVAGTRLIRASETEIPIEAVPWTASFGASVYCDQRSVPKLVGNKIEGYDFGISMSNCHQIDYSKNEFIDIAKEGISGAAKSGLIQGNRFVRGGQYRLTDGGYASRNIILSAGSENITVSDNEFGIDANYIETSLQTSADVGCLRIRGNSYDGAISEHRSIATQSNERLDRSQFNDIAGGDWHKSGAPLTGPSTWYESLQNAIVRYHGTAAPTRGFHRAGSEWVHTTPTVGQPIGGICTVSGTPGTWASKTDL